MSKRFGRNRKNALRARAAFLERLNEQVIADRVNIANGLKAEIEDLKRRLKQMREFHDNAVAETKRIAQEVEEVCYNSAILPAKYQETAEPPIQWRQCVRGPMTSSQWLRPSPGEDPVEAVSVNLEEVGAALEQDPMRLQRIVHLWAGQRRACYTLSEDALRMAGRLGRVRDELHRQVADAMIGLWRR